MLWCTGHFDSMPRASPTPHGGFGGLVVGVFVECCGRAGSVLTGKHRNPVAVRSRKIFRQPGDRCDFGRIEYNERFVLRLKGGAHHLQGGYMFAVECQRAEPNADLTQAAAGIVLQFLISEKAGSPVGVAKMPT